MQVGFDVEHPPLARIEPIGVYVQFLNKDVAVAGGEPGFARLDHRKGCFPDAKSLCELFLSPSEFFSYQFYPFVCCHGIEKFYIKNLTFRVSKSIIELIFAATKLNNLFLKIKTFSLKKHQINDLFRLI